MPDPDEDDIAIERPADPPPNPFDPEDKTAPPRAYFFSRSACLCSVSLRMRSVSA